MGGCIIAVPSLSDEAAAADLPPRRRLPPTKIEICLLVLVGHPAGSACHVCPPSRPGLDCGSEPSQCARTTGVLLPYRDSLELEHFMRTTASSRDDQQSTTAGHRREGGSLAPSSKEGSEN